MRKQRKGTAFVDELDVDDDAADKARLQRNTAGDLIAVRLDADELVDARIDASALSIVRE